MLRIAAIRRMAYRTNRLIHLVPVPSTKRSRHTPGLGSWRAGSTERKTILEGIVKFEDVVNLAAQD